MFKTLCGVLCLIGLPTLCQSHDLMKHKKIRQTPHAPKVRQIDIAREVQLRNR